MTSPLSAASDAANTAISGTNGTARATATNKSDARQAAEQFEAIFLRKMLAEARKTHFDNGLFTDSGAQTFRDMQDAHFAEVASQSDAFGLARIIEARLARQTGTASADPAATSGATSTGQGG
ncbi:peptidoglycan hydrolase [Novosphingobium sp. FSY-8]|uniref:Peptidoglycan hydrolase n=1 Tax=Novosphingobium ovatum TaxID=1908523 RepID=A0ABW9XG25_9SPHN|nr:rod-binding protein [Novosphingobium ovatum]NBC37500.1 peptidoglycan hydrolase [Novosphingobium ovatum]